MVNTPVKALLSKKCNTAASRAWVVEKEQKRMLEMDTEAQALQQAEETCEDSINAASNRDRERQQVLDRRSVDKVTDYSRCL